MQILRDSETPFQAIDAADAELAASGDVHAFERLYHKHVGRVHSLTRRMIGGEEADEVTQEVFVRAWRKLGTMRGESSFGTWLHRLAVNVLLSHRKSAALQRQRHATLSADLGEGGSPGSAPDLAIDFEAAIETLPDGARQVFVLHDIEGYKHGEIAELLGVTPGTSKSQLHRARMLLREYLKR